MPEPEIWRDSVLSWISQKVSATAASAGDFIGNLPIVSDIWEYLNSGGPTEEELAEQRAYWRALSKLPLDQELFGMVVRKDSERDRGNIACARLPGLDVFFMDNWLEDIPRLQSGEPVTFKAGQSKNTGYRIRLNAYEIERLESDEPRARLTDWADLGYLPETLSTLAAMALKEDWKFKTNLNAHDSFPILRSYLFETYARLALERKIAFNESRQLACFDTGLVNKRLEPICGVFERRNDAQPLWVLRGFCSANDEGLGKWFESNFGPKPARAHYFDCPEDTLYNAQAEIPDLKLEHIIVERLHRWPKEFVRSHLPAGVKLGSTKQMSEQELQAYFGGIGKAIEADHVLYDTYIARLRRATELSVNRVVLNFRTAVPTYYPKFCKVQLLLPICLERDGEIDAALVLDKTPAGGYLGRTILTLDMAYKNSRLLCRPDSDWLSPLNITDDSSQ